MPAPVGQKPLGNNAGVALAQPDATWQARVSIASFNKDGLKPLDVDALPKTKDVKAVLALAGTDPANHAGSPLNVRPGIELSAHRDDKSKQFAILAWEPMDFMGTLHVFDNAGNALGKVQILD